MEANFVEYNIAGCTELSNTQQFYYNLNTKFFGLYFSKCYTK